MKKKLFELILPRLEKMNTFLIHNYHTSMHLAVFMQFETQYLYALSIVRSNTRNSGKNILLAKLANITTQLMFCSAPIPSRPMSITRWCLKMTYILGNDELLIKYIILVQMRIALSYNIISFMLYMDYHGVR